MRPSFLCDINAKIVPNIVADRKANVFPCIIYSEEIKVDLLNAGALQRISF